MRTFVVFAVIKNNNKLFSTIIYREPLESTRVGGKSSFGKLSPVTIGYLGVRI